MEQDTRVSLEISELEAELGTARTLSLPGGQRVAVSIPSGVYSGQELQFPGQVHPVIVGERPGTLILTLNVLGSKPAPDTTISREQALDVTLPAGLQEESETTVLTPPPPVPAQPVLASPPPPPIMSGETPLPPPALLGNSAGNWPAYGPPPLQQPRQSSISARAILLAVLAIVVVAGSTGLFFVIHNAQTNANNAKLSATFAANSTATGQVDAQLTNEAEDATSIANSTATVVQATVAVNNANPDPYGQGGQLVVYDPLDGSQSSVWSHDNNCAFQNSSYNVSVTVGAKLIWCNRNNIFTDFAVDVKMTIHSGDLGGIVFRDLGNEGYFFLIDSRGYWRIGLYKNDNGNPTILAQAITPSPAVHTGQNSIAVVAQNSQFSCYINSELVDQVSDNTFPLGNLGLAAGTYNNSGQTSARVSYTSMRIWDLDQ